MPRLLGKLANASERNGYGLGEKRKSFVWPQKSGLAIFPLSPFLFSPRRRRHQYDRRYVPSQYLITLYRLRVKANYIDDELFSQGPENDSDAEEFAARMQSVVAATLLVHELRLGKLLGPKWVLNQADTWLHRNTARSAAHGLAARRQLLANA